MKTIHSNLNVMGSLNRIQRRNLLEVYCNIANLLPIQERMLFQMYYRHGYSTIEISQLLMVHNTTISRRLKKIGTKLTNLISGESFGKQAGTQSPQPAC